MSAPGRHLALLLPELESGGAQRVMLSLADGLARRGHRVDLLVLDAAGPLRAAVPSSVRLVDLGVRGNRAAYALRAAAGLTGWLRRERPAALLSTISGTNIVAVVARALGSPSTRLALREAVTLDNVASPGRLCLMRWLYPKADCVIALSHHMAAQLGLSLGIPRALIRCIANPVDSDRIRNMAAHPLDHPWLAQTSGPLIVAVGRLIPQKDFATLLQAFARLPTALGARLAIVGEGPERGALEQLALRLGCADRVLLVGFDPNPWRWMSGADLLASSSRWEGHPNVLLEALALGLPIVSTIYDPSALELRALADGLSLGFVNAGDAEAMSLRMAEALSDPAGRGTGVPSSLDAAIDAYEEALV
ncbi:MAG: glycosyltransferase [Rhodocyclaceae bacterium]|nr:glycosyltransferase [Rhodocyclaceae bacterium]